MSPAATQRSSAIPARAYLSIGEVLAKLRPDFSGRHDLQDPLPGVRGAHRAAAHAVGLPQVHA